MSLNIRVEVWVDVNVDQLTNRQTKNWIPISHHAKAGATKIRMLSAAILLDAFREE